MLPYAFVPNRHGIPPGVVAISSFYKLPPCKDFRFCVCLTSGSAVITIVYFMYRLQFLVRKGRPHDFSGCGNRLFCIPFNRPGEGRLIALDP